MILIPDDRRAQLLANGAMAGRITEAERLLAQAATLGTSPIPPEGDAP